MKILRSITFFPIDKIYTYVEDESNRDYANVCNESAVKLLTDTMKMLVIIGTSAVIFAVFPIIASLQNDEVQFMIPVLFPFTNLETKTGIIVNMLNQFLSGSLAMTSNFGIEILNCILKNAVWCSASAVCYSVDELSPILKKSKQLSSIIINYRFRNIVIQVQDIDRYFYCSSINFEKHFLNKQNNTKHIIFRFVLSLASLSYWRFFLQPIFLAFGVSLALFLYLNVCLLRF